VLTIDKFKHIFRVIKKVVIFEYIIVVLEILNLFRWPASPYSRFSILLKRNTVDIDSFNNYIASLVSVPTGFHGNPNNLALFVNMVFPFFLFAKRLSVRLAGSVITLGIIISTGSRGNFLAFFAGIIIYLYMKYKKTFILLLMMSMLFFITGLFDTVVDIAKKSKNDRISEMASTVGALTEYLSKRYEYRGDSISVRRQLMENGITELKKTGGFGIGGGASQFVQKTIYHSEITTMHNFWVEILVEGGVIIFVSFLVWYILLVFKLLFVSRRTNNNFVAYISRALSLSMCIYSIGCISVSIVIYYLNMWLMFGMAISIIFIHKTARNEY
jgi:teichuronic acid biosynthesis protein TuaE